MNILLEDLTPLFEVTRPTLRCLHDGW